MTAIPTTIVAATVYVDRARVTRRGALTLEPGPHTLEVMDLPIRTDPDSVRATARGTAHARLLGVEVQRTFFTETPAEEVRRLEEQVETVQDELHNIEARSETLAKNRAALNGLAGETRIFATALAAGEMSAEAQIALFDGLRAGVEKLDADLQQTAIAKRQAERRLAKLQNELSQQRSARPRQRYSAILEVEVLQPGELSVDVSYVVGAASWKPLYDLRLVEGEGESSFEVGYLAQVTQQTGETWQDASLALSTARPSLAGRLPELDPWYVLPQQPPPSRGVRFMPAAAQQAHVSQEFPLPKAATPAAEEFEAEEITASVEDSGAAVSYKISGTVNIPSDGAPHKVVLARFSLPPTLDYVTAPRLVEAVYRRATLVNDSPYVFLPGTANLFAGDEFVGATSMELTAPQGEIEMYLGVDDRIKVERELKRRDVDKRLIGGKRRVVYGYEITLQNLLPVETKITLHDQIPASRHEEIKVKLETATPKPSQQSELNLLDWEFVLASQENRQVRFDFSVEYPQGMEVTGLP